MFIFYFLGVGLPCCSIFCQFWLWEEAQCVYLRRHLGSLNLFSALLKKILYWISWGLLLVLNGIWVGDSPVFDFEGNDL